MRNCWLIFVALLAFAILGWALRPVPLGNDIEVTTSIAADGRLELRYILPSDSFVTLVIDDERGKRIRNLIGAEARKGGLNVETWDGTDDGGQPVPAGSYRWRILRHSGVNVEYLMSYGNPGSPPWASADGKGGWGGDHTSPQAAVITPDGVILGWPMAESGWFLIGVDPDGHKQWGLKNRFAFGDTRIALAADGEYLYVASEQNPAPLQHYYKKLAHAVLYRYRLSDRRLAKFGDSEEIVVSDQMDGNVSGVAVTGDTAYVALRKENRLAAISLTDGKAAPERDLAIPSPTGVAIDKSGGLIILSGHQAVRIDLKTRESRVLISDDLEDPVGLHIDRSGSIYIADREQSQQVKVFTASGKPLKTIGVAGGRSPRGPYKPGGMYQPLGITVDGKGQLWVMEEDDQPKRVSVWNAATGEFLREYIGPPHYGALEGSVADFDKTMAFGEGVQYRLDWNNKTYHFVATPSRAVNDDDIFGRAAIRRFFRIKGRVITASNSHVQVIAEMKDGVLHPLAALGEIDELTRRAGMYSGAVARKIEQLKNAGIKIDAKGNPSPGTAFIWTDQNGDGIAQDSEFVWRDKLQWGGYWGTNIGSDLTIYMPSAGRVYRLPVTVWTAHGAPVYTFESATTIPYSGSAEHVAALNDGTLIVNARPQLLGINIATGQQEWSYPNIWEGVQGSHTADVPAPGRLIGPLSITGSADLGGGVGTVFAMNGNLGQQFLMTSDGMWIGAVLRDWRLAKVEDMYTVPDEDFGGYFWRDQSSGEVFLEAGKSEYRLYRVTGLDTIRRSEGRFALLSPISASSREGAARSASSNIPTVGVARIDPPQTISGRLEDFPKSLRFTEVAADAGSKFRFALARDQQNLYLAYDVTDDTPFQNDGHDAKQMFSTGDCVDLMIGVDPKADPRRKEGTAGDKRLLLTVMDGKPLAMLYDQVDPTRNWPVAFLSPARAVYFGAVTQLQDVRMAVTRNKTGYVLTAAVPLATLGIKPETSPMLSGDVGVVFGSESGNGARLRLYWANKETAITSDIPSEAALAPKNWGHFQFEQ